MEDGLYIVIRSFESLSKISPFIQFGSLCTREKINIVNVESIYNSEFVIPDIRDKNKNQKYFFLPSRENWEDNFSD